MIEVTQAGITHRHPYMPIAMETPNTAVQITLSKGGSIMDSIGKPNGSLITGGEKNIADFELLIF